ncbi:MAG: hypothetical protein IPN60_15850 [Saprospiraceae bacterium]|nr:hypothetical protein [Candidatus Opimibacter skivensis]
MSGTGSLTNNSALNINISLSLPSTLAFVNNSTINIGALETLTINGNGTWNSGTISGPGIFAVGATGTLTLATGSTKFFTADISNAGTIDWQDGIFRFEDFKTVTNSGTFLLSGNTSFQHGIPGAGIFTNNGTVTKTSSGNTDLDVITVNNNGTFNCNAGTISNNNDIFNNNPGSFIKGTATFDNINAFVNDGTIAPGNSPGILTINGQQPFSANSTLQIEMLDGSGPGTGHDQLQRNGNLTLAGNITVTADPGVPNGTYTIIDLTSGDISGTFDSETLPPGYTLDIDLTNDEVKVTKAPLVSLSTHYFRSIVTGNWNDPGTWESSPVSDFSSGIINPATLAPDDLSSGITIWNTHNVTVTMPVTADQIVVDAGSTLTQTNNLTLANGAGDDLTVNGTMDWQGGILSGSGLAKINGTLTWGSGELAADLVTTASAVTTKSVRSQITAGSVSNGGAFTWTSGDINFYNATSFTNTATGTFTITGNNNFQQISGTPSFTNAGT